MDTMMQGINTWLWPYMAIAMYNELNKVCIACEAIMLAELTLAYTFLVHFLFEHVPGRQPQDALVASVDDIFPPLRQCCVILVTRRASGRGGSACRSGRAAGAG